MKVFLGEALTCAVIIGGCTQMLCGNSWLNCFKESIQEEVTTEEKPFHATFKFENDDVVSSSRRIVLPVTIGS